MEILELTNKNEALKRKLEVMDELKSEKKKEKAVEEIVPAQTSNVTANANRFRFVTVKERLACGFEQFFQDSNHQSNLHESYTEWYQSITGSMQHKQLYSSEKKFHFVKKDCEKYQDTLSFTSKRTE